MICTNPIIRGFYPDPSICSANGKYYLVNSSFEYFPGIPVFESEDMVEWRQIGHVLTRPSQLDLAGVYFSGGIYAPTIRFHNGRFYVVVTNVSSKDGNFYVYTDDIHSNNWSDPIRVARDGIDPSLLFDDDGRVYFASNGRADNGEYGISICEINIETGALLSPARCISKGSGGRNVEGPHVYKINGWYYLLTAEGGTEYGHMECLFRSRNIWGPYEGCPWNPILTSRDSPWNIIQATGHADIVEGPGGQWFIVHLGIRQHSRSARSYHNLGRETCLMPIFWSDDGWFKVGEDNICREQWSIENGKYIDLSPIGKRPIDRPCQKWALDPAAASFLRTPDYNRYRFDSPNSCAIQGATDRLGSRGQVTWVGMRQDEWDASMAVILDGATLADGQSAGITAYMNELDHYDVVVTRSGDTVTVAAVLHLGEMTFNGESLTMPTGPVALRIDGNADTYKLFAGAPATEPTLLATGVSRYLSTEVTGGFTGVYLALFSDAPENGAPSFARFSW